MIGPEPVIAIAGSQRAWASELLRFLSDFGGARLKGTVLTAREALEPGYQVLIIDDITSYLSPRLVERVKDSGQKVVGIYDPESGERGRERLRVLGVDAIIPADAGPEAILETVSSIGPGRPPQARERVAEPLAPASAARITTVAGGDIAGDFAVALGGAFRARRRTTLVVDADTVTPMLAQRALDAGRTQPADRPRRPCAVPGECGGFPAGGAVRRHPSHRHTRGFRMGDGPGGRGR